MLPWLQLLFCLAVIGIAGYSPFRYGDIIAGKSGISASWTGLILPSPCSAVPADDRHVIGPILRHAEQLCRSQPGLTWVIPGLSMLYVLNSWIPFGHAHSL
jgi:hypothetical protein